VETSDLVSDAAVETATTFLFVPGDRPERFAKAAAAGADVIILDLEDAVAPEAKPRAREHVRTWLGAGGPGMVRVNPPGTPWHEEDLAALAGAAVMLPKAQDPAVVAAVVAALAGGAGSGGTGSGGAGSGAGAAVVVLVETALGIHRAVEVCGVPGVVRAAFGSVDLAAELGVDPTDAEALRFARSALVLGARAAGLGAPVDGVTTAVRDEEVLRADCAHGLSLGFTGKMCIHPSQVAPVAAAFAPSAAEIAWAETVLAAASEGGVAVVDGKMVDKPVVDRAQALLGRAGLLP
jgi:citrate lyase subunit beta / citryl-CoA lyase